MKLKLMIVVAMGWCAAVFADSYILNKTGAWNALDSWVTNNVVPTRLPDVTDSTSITFGRTVTIDSYAAQCGSCAVAYGVGESGTIQLNSGSFFSQGIVNVGRAGNGFFYQAAGSTNTFASGYLCLGEQKEGTGYYKLNGGFVGGVGTGDKVLYIGYNGTGVFHQVGGELGHIGTDKYLNMANVAGSDGTYVQDGGALLFTNKTWMTVGHFGNARFLQTNGSVRVTGAVETYVGRKSGGRGLYRTVGGTSTFGTIKFGDEAGSSGTLEALGGALTATYLYAGFTGTGSVLQTAGSISAGNTLYIGREATSRGFFRINGGTTECGTLIMADKVGSAGTLAIDGGRIGVTNNCNAGYVGPASVVQTAGVLESIPKASGDSYWYLGNTSTSTGRYVMVGGEINWTNANNHGYIGEFGRGEMYQTNGIFRVRNWLTVSRKTGSSGFYRIAGGRLEVSDTLQLSEAARSASVFEICGTNAVISCKNFTAWTNNLWRVNIAAGGLSPVNVATSTSLRGILEVSVPYANYKTQTVLLNCGSGSTTLNFSQVRTVPPLMKVTVAQVGSQVVLKNFQYLGTAIILR